MGRALGVDVGEVRVGLALSDPSRLIASPHATVAAGRDLAARIAAVAGEQGADVVVVGLPKALSGRGTASTQRARAVADDLRTLGVSVTLWDERLSSVEAERVLLAADRSRDQRRAERDRVAAAIILQSWLDAQRPPAHVE